MKNQATYDDANLILRLYDLRREEKMRTARRWLGSIPPIASREQFAKLCPPGSEENAYYRMVTTYWDMAASFVVNGILNRELFYRSNNMELLVVWVKVKGVTMEMREVNKNPLTNRNIEEVAAGFIDYLNQHAPGFYDTLASNIARAGQPASRT
jgi:hypothetical protein